MIGGKTIEKQDSSEKSLGNAFNHFASTSLSTVVWQRVYFLEEMITYLLVTPTILFFCMADTTPALKRSEASGS